MYGDLQEEHLHFPSQLDSDAVDLILGVSKRFTPPSPLFSHGRLNLIFGLYSSSSYCDATLTRDSIIRDSGSTISSGMQTGERTHPFPSRLDESGVDPDLCVTQIL